jgi:subtilisin-like proprotein convertase family protein
VVTVSIKDNATRTTSISYTLKVDAVNDAPSISSIDDLTGAEKGVQAGASVNVVFQVSDLETDGKSLRVSAKARKAGVLPEVASTSIPDANLTFSESGTNRVLNITTIGTSAELVTVTVSVTDGDLTTHETFNIEVFAPQPVPGTVYADTTPAAIVSLATTNLVPITVTTSGTVEERSFAKLHRVSVAIAGISHAAPDDLDVLLVAPDGRGVILMSDAGGRSPVSNLVLEFSDGGANGALRDDGPLAPGVFVPSNYSGDLDAWAGFTGTIVRNLSDLNGINPNGQWRLLVSDDAANDAGNIAQGWSLKIVTTPVIRLDTVGGGVSLVVHDEDTDGISRLILSDLDVPGATISGYEITKTSSDANVITPLGINVPLLFNSVQYTATPVAHTYDTSTNLTTTVTLTRKSDRASSSISLKHWIRPINDAPEITRTTDRSTNEDVPMSPLSITFTDQTDPGEPASGPVLLDVVALSDNQGVVSDTNILVYGFNNVVSNRVAVERGSRFDLVVVPNANAAPHGQPTNVLITIVATDRNTNAPANRTSSASRGFGVFQVTINPRNDAPSITKPDNQTVETGGSRTVTVTVADPDDTDKLKVTAVSSDERVIKSSNIVITPVSGGPGNRTVFFRVEPNLEPPPRPSL